MNKMNKKGFTLIEMLVVIAIIAILVAIIIPTVTSATDKASAATNAANLRSIKAEVSTAYLTNDQSKYTFGTGNSFTVTTPTSLPKSKKCSNVEKDLTAVITFANKEFTVTYDGATIDDFAQFAEGTKTAVGTP